MARRIGVNQDLTREGGFPQVPPGLLVVAVDEERPLRLRRRQIANVIGFFDELKIPWTTFFGMNAQSRRL